VNRWAGLGEQKSPSPRYRTPDGPAYRLVTTLTTKQVITRPAGHQVHSMRHASSSNY
jgi:hypothetical protein